MNRKNIVVLTLVISVLLIGSMLSGTAINLNNSSEDSLVVEKVVWDGDSWEDEIQANIGDTVTFQITVTYYNVSQPGSHYACNIFINDTLPDCLEYDVGTATPDEPTIDDMNLTWDLGSTVLMDGESYVITFNCTVIDFGENINLAKAEAYEHCCSRYIRGSDTATVNVEYPICEISLEKKVWDTCEWVNEIWEYQGETVRFQITIENLGDTDLTNLIINDTLSDSLEYVIDSAEVDGVPYEPIIDDKVLTWTWNILDVGETLVIEFDALVIGQACSVDINLAEVWAYCYCDDYVYDKDTAIVNINGMCMEKEVWDEDLQEWMEETEGNVGDEVRFRITIYYYGDEYKLYNIHVTDQLPMCLEYADDATPEEPEISSDGKTLWWNFTDNDDALYHGDTLVIEFNAAVVANNCEPCINWAYVVANECSGSILEWEDPATVIIDCAFEADAGGPYYGDVGEDITITGSATGGDIPYTYEWDLDDDGEYDDATGEEIVESWDESGNYVIWLKVTDDDDDEAYAYAYVNIAAEENEAPLKPSTPTGDASGRPGTSFTYESTTTDPEGGQIWYLFDWDDGTDSGWIGPYASGVGASVSHVWSSQGTYQVKVKAKDGFDAESVWSDPLAVTMPRDRSINSPLFLRLLQRLAEIFPLLNQIFGLLN
jgi:uncharacterized repeat protein (TIGR01451 family)/fimbrial isopeptide formation D2 family protein